MTGVDPDELDPLVGKIVLGRYRIVRELARGGMGAIYLARSEGAASFVKPVVIKRMLPEFVGDVAAAKMFKREARIMSLLRHPGIVSVFDFGREEYGYLLVMDYVHGFHLGRWASWMRERRVAVPVDLTVHVVIQILEALHYAHTLTGPEGEPLQIVHRDISPSNVLLDVGGHVRIADFGIAQSGADAPDVKTATRSVKGKFSYMAPEIIEGAAPTPGTDVYSAAVVLHEVLIGTNEFRTTSPAATINRVISHVPVRLDKARRDVSQALADVVARALSKHPSERFPSAMELARALRKVRTLEAEEASLALSKRFSEDFRDPSLAAMHELPPLDELEAAWRAPTREQRTSAPDPAPRPSELRKKRTSDEPTTDARMLPQLPSAASSDPDPRGVHPLPSAASAEPEPEAAKPPRRSLLALIAFVALAFAATAVAFWITSHEEPEVVYVDARPSGITSSPPLTSSEVPPSETPPAEAPLEVAERTIQRPTATPDLAGRQPPRPTHEDPRAREQRSIQRVVNGLAPRMRSCFDAPPSSELVLRFSIDEHGTVERVEVLPPSIGGSAAGQCVQNLAMRAQFPRGEGSRAFRVPIEVRSH